MSPRLNDAAGQGILDYQEQANAIKFVLPLGDIDFIVAGSVTQSPPPDGLDIEGVHIPLDATSEILGKKLLYHAESFKARDVFDMAVALALDRPAAMEAIQAAAPTRPALLRRLPALEREGRLADALLPTALGTPYTTGMFKALHDALCEADQAGTP